MEDSKEFVKIYCCGDCCNYNRKKHKCMAGATEEGEAKDSFYRDCPLGIHEEPEWIPVSDKLPKVGQSVLGCDMDGGIFVDWLNENHEWAICEQTWAQMVAWMPLPEPYQEAEHERDK